MMAKILFILLTLPVFVCAQSDEYFDRITVYSDGKVVRFTEMPIKVYVEPVSTTPESGGTFLDDLKYALSEWEKCSEGKIKFYLTRKQDDADIRVIWVRHELTEKMDNRMGDAQLIHLENDFEIEVKLSLYQKGSGELLSHEEMRAVCLHEFGHAIGLWGHSESEKDVMFFALSGIQHPTERDRKTLLKVYSHELNYPQHNNALAILKNRIKEQPENPKLHYLIGSVYFDKGDYENAIDAFNRCLELDSSYSSAQEKLVQIYSKTGKEDEAIAIYEGLLEKERSMEIYNSLGSLYYNQGNVQKSVEYLEKALKINDRYRPAKNNLFKVYRERGTKYLKAGDYDVALSDFTRAIELSPTDSEVYDLIGSTYNYKQDYEKAIEYLQKAVSLDPANKNAQNNLAKSYNNLGVELFNQGKFQDSVDAYKQALNISPDNSQFQSNLESAYWGLANHYTKIGKGDEAVEVYRKLLELNPINKDIYSAMAGTYYKFGKYPQAIESFRSALKFDEEDAETRKDLFLTYCQYGQDLIKQRRYQDAVEQFNKALEIQPDDADVLINIGVAYERAGKFDKALTFYKKVLEVQPDNDKIRQAIVNLNINQGNRYMQARKYKSAIAAFEKIPEKDRSSDVSSLIGYLYVTTNKPIQALPHLENALKKNPNDKASYQNLRSIESDFEIKLEKNSSTKVKDKLILTKCSLAKALIYRKKHLEAKSKLRQALDLKPESSDAKKTLIETCIKLSEAFQAKNWTQNAKEVSEWILELKSENASDKE